MASTNSMTNANMNTSSMASTNSMTDTNMQTGFMASTNSMTNANMHTSSTASTNSMTNAKMHVRIRVRKGCLSGTFHSAERYIFADLSAELAEPHACRSDDLPEPPTAVALADPSAELAKASGEARFLLHGGSVEGGTGRW